MILLRNANKGANGNAATKSVTNPYWRTGKTKKLTNNFKNTKKKLQYSFPGIPRREPIDQDPAFGSLLPIASISVSNPFSYSVCDVYVTTSSGISCKKPKSKLYLWRIIKLTAVTAQPYCLGSVCQSWWLPVVCKVRLNNQLGRKHLRAVSAIAMIVGLYPQDARKISPTKINTCNPIRTRSF